jgi:hypothetical protein
MLFSKTGKKKYLINDEPKEIKPYLEKKMYENFSLTKEEIKEIVVLPAGMDINEWLATHSKYFYTCNSVKYVFFHVIYSAFLAIFISTFWLAYENGYF